MVFTYDGMRDLATAFQRSRILLTAYELGVFTALGDKTKASGEVAKIIKTAEKSTDRLMNALCVLGLLQKKKGKFSNTASALRFLVKGKPEYMESLMHTINQWDSWSTLTEAVRRGKTLLTRLWGKRGKKWLVAFIAAMDERASMQARGTVSLIDLSGVSKVLDVGGGSGAFSAAFVRAKKGIKAVVFDLPQVIPITRSYVRQEGLLDKVKTVSGNYNINSLGKGFDLIFLSAIVHSNSFKGNQKLIKKCAGALNPGGQVAVVDFIMDKDRTHSAFGALFALNMLVATQQGDTYTESEVRGWMQDAGLSGIKRKDTAFGTTLIIGRK